MATFIFFFFSSRRRHTRFDCNWSSDVCSSDLKADCYSSDLQQTHIELKVLFRIPESSVVKLFQQYYGEPFESLVAPRVHEALKEVTALQSAEQIVKNREQIKTRA